MRSATPARTIGADLAKSGSREPYWPEGSNQERPDRADARVNR